MFRFLRAFLVAVLPRRRGLQFTLAGLLLLFLIVGVVLALFNNAAHTQKAAAQSLKVDHGVVHYDFEFGPDGAFLADPGSSELRKLLGPDFFNNVVWVELHDRDRTNQVVPSRLDPRTLKALGDLRKVRWLDATGCPLVDEHLSYVARLSRLERVMLDDTWLRGAGLAQLSAAKNLKNLSLARCPLSEEAFAQIAQFTELQELNLTGAPITKTKLERLAGLSRLEQLDLSNTDVDDDMLAALASLNGLQTLSLSSTRVSGPGLESLATLPALKTLILEETLVDDAGLAFLAKSQSLETLQLDGNSLSVKGLAELARLPRLATLEITIHDSSEGQGDFDKKLESAVTAMAEASQVSAEERSAMIGRIPALAQQAWSPAPQPIGRRAFPGMVMRMRGQMVDGEGLSTEQIQALYNRFREGSADEQWAAAEFLSQAAEILEQFEDIAFWRAKVRSDELFAGAIRKAERPAAIFARWAECHPRVLALEVASEALAKTGKSVERDVKKIFPTTLPGELACWQASFEAPPIECAFHLYDMTEDRANLRIKAGTQWRQNDPLNAAAWFFGPAETFNSIDPEDQTQFYTGLEPARNIVRVPRLPKPSYQAREAIVTACRELNIEYIEPRFYDTEQHETVASARQMFDMLSDRLITRSSPGFKGDKDSVAAASQMARKLLLCEPREILAIDAGVFVCRKAAAQMTVIAPETNRRRAIVQLHAAAGLQQRFMEAVGVFNELPAEEKDKLVKGISGLDHPLAVKIVADIDAWVKWSDRIAAAPDEELPRIAAEMCEVRQ